VHRYVLVLFMLNMLINLGMGIGGGLFDYYYAEDSPYLTVRRSSTPLRSLSLSLFLCSAAANGHFLALLSLPL
jgi:hypothetical protein